MPWHPNRSSHIFQVIAAQLNISNRLCWKPLLTLSTATSEAGSGDYGRYITDSRIKDEDGFDIDDSDYDIFIEEVGLQQPQLDI